MPKTIALTESQIQFLLTVLLEGADPNDEDELDRESFDNLVDTLRKTQEE